MKVKYPKINANRAITGKAQNIKDEDKMVKNNPIVTGRIAFRLLLNTSLSPLPREIFSTPTISINKFWVDAFSILDVRPNIIEKTIKNIIEYKLKLIKKAINIITINIVILA